MSRASYFPHPVVGFTDVASIFQLSNPRIHTTPEAIEVRFRVHLDDPDLRGFIKAGHARLSARWSCGETLVSRPLELESVRKGPDYEDFRAIIDHADARGTVTVTVRAVATSPITDYRLARQHADYGDATFSIDVASVIGDAGYLVFDAEKLFDPLAPPLGSCFKLIRDPDRRFDVAVDFSSTDQVSILLPDETFEALNRLRSAPRLQLTLIVLPALMETIAFIEREESSGDEDMSEFEWYRTLRSLLAGLDNNLGTFEKAQRLLKRPLLPAALEALNGDDDE